MNIRYMICVLLAALLSAVASAVPVALHPIIQGDTVLVAQVDTLVTGNPDSIAVTEEDFLRLMENQRQQTDTARKVVDRGRDVSRMVNARRQRAVDTTPFASGKFSDNMFISLRGSDVKLMTEDYSFGLMGGFSLGKWFHEDHAVRIDADYGGWRDNFDGSPIRVLELGASYLFNLSSYVGGYRTNRFCEVSVLAGAGYANSNLVKTAEDGSSSSKKGSALSARIGCNVNLRLFRNIDFFIEPQTVLYTNGMALSYAGNWRSWMSAFRTSVGLTYNIRQSYSGDSQRLYPRSDGWFISFAGGPHMQNSDLVYNLIGTGEALGVHISLGGGKHYNDWFAFRFTAAFSRSAWVKYDDELMPCNYFAARAEAMLDVVSLIRKTSSIDKDGRPLFALSLLLGPEAGYMYKKDIQDVVDIPYIGVTGGVQGKFNVTERLSVFAEPRFTVLPYDAPARDPSTINNNRNYYDGVLNMNVGIEFIL